MTTDTTQRIAQIRAACLRVLELESKATPGPWTMDLARGVMSDGTPICYPLGDEETETNNAAFIVHARSITPALARATLTLLDLALDYGCKCEPAEEEAWQTKCSCCQGVSRLAANWPEDAL